MIAVPDEAEGLVTAVNQPFGKLVRTVLVLHEQDVGLKVRVADKCRAVDEDGRNLKAGDHLAVLQIEELDADNAVHSGRVEVIGERQRFLFNITDDMNGQIIAFRADPLLQAADKRGAEMGGVGQILRQQGDILRRFG
ncbi:hypothetical protein D3C75_351750 [compost metagenome]